MLYYVVPKSSIEPRPNAKFLKVQILDEVRSEHNKGENSGKRNHEGSCDNGQSFSAVGGAMRSGTGAATGSCCSDHTRLDSLLSSHGGS